MGFLDYVKVGYDSIDFKNYMVFSQTKPVTVINHCCKVIENNVIAGLLPMYSKKMNDQVEFYYDISAKVKLTDYLSDHCFREEDGKKILFNIVSSLKNLQEYFIKQELCVLEPDLIFINDAHSIFFPILPIEEMEHTPDELKSFLQELLSKYFVSEIESTFYNNLLIYLVRNDFDPERFLEKVSGDLHSEENKKGSFTVKSDLVREETVPKENLKPPENHFNKPIQSNEYDIRRTVPEKKEPSLNPGFKIPGGEEVEIPQRQSIFARRREIKEEKKQKKKLEKEKKELLKAQKKQEKKTCWFFGGRKERNQEEPVENVIPEKNPIQYEQQSSFEVERNEYDDSTEMLDYENFEQEKAYLIYDEKKISITKFPYMLGKSNLELGISESHVSRKHARIWQEEGEYYLTDENSKNHTYLNGVQLIPYKKYRLKERDKIKLALEEMIFHER